MKVDQVSRRQFLTTGAATLAGISLLPKEASASEPESISQHSPQQKNQRPSISNDPMTPVYIIGAAFTTVALLVTPGAIIDHTNNKKVNEAFRKADEAERNRAKARLRLKELNTWGLNQSSTC